MTSQCCLERYFSLEILFPFISSLSIVLLLPLPEIFWVLFCLPSSWVLIKNCLLSQAVTTQQDPSELFTVAIHANLQLGCKTLSLVNWCTPTINKKISIGTGIFHFNLHSIAVTVTDCLNPWYRQSVWRLRSKSLFLYLTVFQDYLNPFVIAGLDFLLR